MKKIIILLSLMLPISVLAQNKSVKGTVTSAEDQMSIPGATVIVPGTSTGTITDFDGNYQLILPDGQNRLMFSFMGMKKKVVDVNERTTIDVELENETVGLEEVVVTSFGIKREKKALGYAVQELDGAEIAKAGQTGITNALQGKVAGVVVKQSSGMPGASSQITIRGSNSLSYNNQPLYVIDGMPVESGSSFENDPENGTDASSRAMDINPDDIETINILKGPTAAALYGLRASNGVVVITTKSGKNAKGKAVVSFSSNFTVDKVSRLPSIQKIYSQGVNGEIDIYSPYSWGKEISSLVSYTNQFGETETAGNYNNITPFFRTGNTHQNSVDVSGAGEIGNYSIGFGSANIKGIVPTTGMDRYTAKFNGQFAINKAIKIGASSNFSVVGIDKVPGGSNYSNPLFSTYFAPPSYNLWGTPFEYENNEFIQYNYRNNTDNPQWALKHNDFREETKRYFGNLNIIYTPFDWLSFNYRVGSDNFTTTGKEVLEIGSAQTSGRALPALYNPANPSTYVYLNPSQGQIDKYIFEQSQFNSNAGVTIDKYFSEYIHFNLLVGNEIYDIKTNSSLLQGKNFGIGGLHNLSNTIDQTTYEKKTHQRVFGLFSNLAIEYKSLLFVTLSGRNDLVSNMPAGSRSFFYPSAAIGFVFTELDALSNISYFPFGKLRASLAQVGQAGPIYGTKNVFTAGGHYNSFIATGGYRFPINGHNGYTTGNSINSNTLQPQNTATLELGLDLRFFDNRLGLDFSYYQIDATQQIYRVPVAQSTGYVDELRNGGQIKTQGEEIIFKLKPIKKTNFEWDITANFSAFKNEVVSLEEGVSRLQAGTKNFNTFGVYGYVGHSFPVIFGSTFQRDNSGNIVVDSRETISSGEKNPSYGYPMIGKHDVLGNVQPDFTLGFNSKIRYKAFTLDWNIDIQKGGHIYSGMNALLRAYGLSEETLDRTEQSPIQGVKGYIDNQTGELIVEGINDIAVKKDKAYWDDVLYYIAESAVFETSFIRLRDVTLTFEIPEDYSQKVKIKGASFFISARNLLLITDYPNFDPESTTSSGNGSGGYEYISLPNSRSFGAGVRLKFY